MTSAPFFRSKGELAVAALTLSYMATALVAALVRRNDEFLYYFVVMCILIVAAGAVHLCVRFPLFVLWGLSFWGLAHMAGGLAPTPATWPTGGEGKVLYNLWLVPGYLKYDQIVHAYGFGLVTWICWIGLGRIVAGQGGKLQPTFGALVLCVAGGMGFGAANEVVEFIAVLTLPNTNVGGYENTGWDLVANFVGCLVAATIIALRGTRQGKGE